MGLFVNGVLTKLKFIIINFRIKKENLKKIGILLIHGLWEHQGRHDINASWFKNLNIDPFLMDLPGHGNNTEVFGHIEKWDEIENSVEQAYKKLNQYDIKLVFGISFGGQVGLHCILKGIIDPDFLILSAPSLGDNYPQFIKTLSKSLSKFTPRLRVPSSANKRNLSTKEVSSIINSNDHTFINLQYGNINDHLSELNEISEKPLYQVPGVDLTYNIDSLASIIKNCDLIITIDNSTAHLAAVLGKPVWILIPFNNDFRWMENSENTIWYKNALLVRQNKKNDWSESYKNI